MANKLHRIDHHCSCLRQVPAILSSWLYRWVVYQMYGSCGVLRAWPAYWHIGDVLSPHCQRCAEYRYRNHRRGVISNTVADKPARLDRYVYLFEKFTVVKNDTQNARRMTTALHPLCWRRIRTICATKCARSSVEISWQHLRLSTCCDKKHAKLHRVHNLRLVPEICTCTPIFEDNRIPF